MGIIAKSFHLARTEDIKEIQSIISGPVIDLSTSLKSSKVFLYANENYSSHELKTLNAHQLKSLSNPSSGLSNYLKYSNFSKFRDPFPHKETQAMKDQKELSKFFKEEERINQEIEDENVDLIDKLIKKSRNIS